MILITGAAGLIGSAVVRNLNQQGETDLLLVDHLANDDKWQNLQSLQFYRYYEKDHFFYLLKQAKQELEAIDLIIHLGANSNTREQNLSLLIENNYNYSIELAKFAMARQIRMVYASSAATYGQGSFGFDDDLSQLQQLRPLNGYGYSKHLFDLWLKRQNFKPSFVGLKYFNIYGPNEYHKGEMRSLVLKAYLQIQNTGQLELFKSERSDVADGKQMRDFLYVTDAAKITNFFALESRESRGIFNVGSGESKTWLDLAQYIFAAMNIPKRIKFIEMPKDLAKKYQYYTQANIGRLQKTGYSKSFISLKDGVSEYVTQYLANDFLNA